MARMTTILRQKRVKIGIGIVIVMISQVGRGRDWSLSSDDLQLADFLDGFMNNGEEPVERVVLGRDALDRNLGPCWYSVKALGRKSVFWASERNATGH